MKNSPALYKINSDDVETVCLKMADKHQYNYKLPTMIQR